MAASITTAPGRNAVAAPLASRTTFATATTPVIAARADALVTKTPYIFPSSCANTYSLTSSWFLRDADIYANDLRSETFLYLPSEGNTHWSSCQPTGLGDNYGNEHAMKAYRGMGCPSGWQAFNLGLQSENTYRLTTSPLTWSTAYCCQSGDVLQKNVWRLQYYGSGNYNVAETDKSVCVSSRNLPATHFAGYSTYVYPEQISFVQSSARLVIEETSMSEIATVTVDGQLKTVVSVFRYTRNSYGQTTEIFTQGRAFYPAMSLEWVEEDNATLNPPWPVITNHMEIPSWTSGQVLPSDGSLDRWGHGREEAQPASMRMKVALPIIIVLAVVLFLALLGSLFCCWRKRKATRVATKQRILENERLGVELGDYEGSTADLASGERNLEVVEGAHAPPKRSGLFAWWRAKMQRRRMEGRTTKEELREQREGRQPRELELSL